VRRDGDGFRVNLALQLPRDRASIPVVRHLTQNALAELGVREWICHDVELAVTEACANVLDHAGSGDAYDVIVSVAGDKCEIRVVDVGRGFDYDSLVGRKTTIHDESGRGIALMHALMDNVLLTSEPESGTVVHLVKGLDFDDSAPALQLLQGTRSTG
jgi:serine/threonine-protein kinase RsbW